MTRQQKEKWKPIAGTEGRHEISNMGNVRSLYIWTQGNRSYKKRDKPMPMKFGYTNSGYLQLTLGMNGRRKNCTIHQLVLEAFVGPKPKGWVGAHLNGNKHDNRVENLAWTTYTENIHHKYLHGTMARGSRQGCAKLIENQVKDIILRAKKGERKSQLAKEYGVTPSLVRRICAGSNWKHVHAEINMEGKSHGS